MKGCFIVASLLNKKEQEIHAGQVIYGYFSTEDR